MLCGDATNSEDVALLLGDRKPLLMVTDPPYGIELDSEWRDRAGLNGGEFGSKRTTASKARAAADPQYHAEPSYMKHRTAGHTETSISGDTRADWSDAFELVPSLQIAYVWHASRFTREVLDGLHKLNPGDTSPLCAETNWQYQVMGIPTLPRAYEGPRHIVNVDRRPDRRCEYEERPGEAPPNQSRANENVMTIFLCRHRRPAMKCDQLLKTVPSCTPGRRQTKC